MTKPHRYGMGTLFVGVVCSLGCGSGNDGNPPVDQMTNQDAGTSVLGPPKMELSAESTTIEQLYCATSVHNIPIDLGFPPIEVKNVGESSLSVGVDGSSAWWLMIDSGSHLEIMPGDSKTIQLRTLSNCCCFDKEALDDSLHITTNDPTRPEATLQVHAVGFVYTVAIEPAMLEWTADDFANSDYVTKHVTLTNTSRAPLDFCQITGLDFPTEVFDWFYIGCSAPLVPEGESVDIEVSVPENALGAAPFEQTAVFRDRLATACVDNPGTSLKLKVSATKP